MGKMINNVPAPSALNIRNGYNFAVTTCGPLYNLVVVMYLITYWVD